MPNSAHCPYIMQIVNIQKQAELTKMDLQPLIFVQYKWERV